MTTQHGLFSTEDNKELKPKNAPKASPQLSMFSDSETVQFGVTTGKPLMTSLLSPEMRLPMFTQVPESDDEKQARNDKEANDKTAPMFEPEPEPAEFEPDQITTWGDLQKAIHALPVYQNVYYDSLYKGADSPLFEDTYECQTLTISAIFYPGANEGYRVDVRFSARVRTTEKITPQYNRITSRDIHETGLSLKFSGGTWQQAESLAIQINRIILKASHPWLFRSEPLPVSIK